MRSTLSLALAAFALIATAAGTASAADFYVTTAEDVTDGTCDIHCSLREAIQAANADALTEDTIYLQAASYELTIPGVDEDYGSTGDLDLRTSMKIIGQGPERTTIDANTIDRVFDCALGGVDILIRGVTITGGWSGSQTYPGGSALKINAANSTVALETCILENNGSTLFGTTLGGAIAAQGTNLDIRNSIIRNNSATRGGAIYITGSDTDVTVERSAIYGNSSAEGKGAIDNTFGTVVIYTSTVSNNYAGSGNGGVRNHYGTMFIISSTLSGNTNAEVVAEYEGGGLVTLTRSIIDGHCSVEVGDPSAIETDWYNLESPGDTCRLDLFKDKFNVADAMIGNLDWNGGPTPTHLPERLSPVVDTSFSPPSTCPGPDQRWISRPWDGEADPNTTAECDVGAVERVPNGLFFDPFECGYTTSWSSTVR